MKQFLDHEGLHRFIHDFFATGKPVGAICHGVLAAARSKALYGRRTTCLPFYMERTAYFLTAWKLGTYYRTYPAYVEEEVRAALQSPDHFQRGPTHLMSRGTDTDDSPAFIVEDGTYVSGRWPGDAYRFAKALLARL
jgi:putative intracellular protease/amidase